VTSPCIRNCCLDENDICLGCYRSLTEICAWGEANNAVRQKILHNAAHNANNNAAMIKMINMINRKIPDGQ